MEFSAESLKGTGLEYVSIKEGVYTFEEISEKVKYNDIALVSYGKVILDIETKY